MKLADYLASKEMTAQVFADSIGRAPSTVTRLLRGETVPDRATMLAIIDATSGAVTPNDFFDLKEGAA
jgi:transcriptional regulator with XRE-family HTH domain